MENPSFIIAVSLLKESFREKVFLGSLLLLLSLICLLPFLSAVSAGEEARIAKNFSLAATELFLLLTITFFITYALAQTKRSGMLELYIARFGKERCLSGISCGILLIMLSFLLIAAAGFSVILILIHAWHLSFLFGIFFIFLKIAVIAAFTLLMSVLFNSPVIGYLLTLGFYIAAELASSARAIIYTHGTGLQKIMIGTAYRILPNMDKLDMKTLATYGNIPHAGYIVSASVYSALYVGVLFFLALMIFKKREYA